jgi:protein-disulfide isomerase
MASSVRYFLAGVVLTGLLVGSVLVLRRVRPLPSSAGVDFVRAQGPLDAPVQIIEYSDFQCGACQVAQPILFGLMGQYAGKLRLVFQHFPLEGHRWSPLAHQAAECAARQKNFWSYHDRLYAGQTVWTVSVEPPIETFIRYAQEAGLDLNGFARCLSDRSVYEKIQQEKSAGVDLGVRSTPSFFVNGELIIGGPALREKVEKLILQGK